MYSIMYLMMMSFYAATHTRYAFHFNRLPHHGSPPAPIQSPPSTAHAACRAASARRGSEHFAFLLLPSAYLPSHSLCLRGLITCRRHLHLHLRHTSVLISSCRLFMTSLPPLRGSSLKEKDRLPLVHHLPTHTSRYCRYARATPNATHRYTRARCSLLWVGLCICAILFCTFCTTWFGCREDATRGLRTLRTAALFWCAWFAYTATRSRTYTWTRVRHYFPPLFYLYTHCQYPVLRATHTFTLHYHARHPTPLPHMPHIMVFPAFITHLD